MKIKLKKNLFFFSNFQKIGLGGSVKRKLKKLWPKVYNIGIFVVIFFVYSYLNLFALLLLHDCDLVHDVETIIHLPSITANNIWK